MWSDEVLFSVENVTILGGGKWGRCGQFGATLNIWTLLKICSLDVSEILPDVRH